MFQGRYSALRDKTDGQLIQLLLYILRNTIKEGIVDRNNIIYPWSSGPEYIGRKVNKIISMERLPEEFTDAPKLAKLIMDSSDKKELEDIANLLIDYKEVNSL